jgi:hypothetical protein
MTKEEGVNHFLVNELRQAINSLLRKHFSAESLVPAAAAFLLYKVVEAVKSLCVNGQTQFPHNSRRATRNPAARVN